MKNSRMSTMLAVCALALAALGSVKNPVTRPFEISGHVEATLQSVSGTLATYDFIDVGEATHAGAYVNRGVLVIDMLTGAQTGSGVATAANGDTLQWTGAGPAPGYLTVTFSGGTRRFTNAKGEVVCTPTAPVVPGPTVSFDYNGEGTLTY